jgi:hypothetical protein
MIHAVASGLASFREKPTEVFGRQTCDGQGLASSSISTHIQQPKVERWTIDPRSIRRWERRDSILVRAG